MPRAKPTGDLYRCTETFMVGDGSFLVVHKGDLIRAGHPLLRQYPNNFGPVGDEIVRFDIEQATAAPGEKRGA